MSASARVPQVDEAVNFRDLALGINDWYNVTPSVRVAIEGLALVVQDQAARLERFEAHFGLHPNPPTGAQRPGTARSITDGAGDVAMLSERVEHLSQELAATKAKLRAVESSRGGADDALASAAERACDLATKRAETAARPPLRPRVPQAAPRGKPRSSPERLERAPPRLNKLLNQSSFASFGFSTEKLRSVCTSPRAAAVRSEAPMHAGTR